MASTSSDCKQPRAPHALYANYFEVGHNALEFIVDFGQYHAEETSVQVHTRIVTGPRLAKLLIRLLVESLQRYESDHGTITDVDDELAPFELVKHSRVSRPQGGETAVESVRPSDDDSINPGGTRTHYRKVEDDDASNSA
jgi:hypothetical protein